MGGERLCAEEGVVEVGAEVVTSKRVEESGLVHHEEGLGVGCDEEEVAVVAAEFGVEVLEGVEAGGVHGEHGAHAQEQDVGDVANLVQGGFEPVGDAEGERAEDFKEGDALGEFAAGEGVRPGLGFGVFLDEGDTGGFGDAFEEQERGKDHADLDRDGEVDEHGEEESGEVDGGVAFGPAGEAGEEVPFAHAEGDDNKDGAEGAEGDVAGEGGGGEEEGEEDEGVENAGKGGPRAVAEVGDGAGDRAGSGDSAEKRGGQVGDALCDEFLIGVVAFAGEAVGNDGGEKRGDGGEEGDGEGGFDEFRGIDAGEGGEAGEGESGGDAAEAGAEGGEVPGEEEGGEGAKQQDGHWGWQKTGEVAGPEQEHEEGKGSVCEGGEMEGMEVGGDGVEFRGEGEGEFREVEAHEVPQLHTENEDGDPGGEAHGDGVGNEPDEGPHAGKAHDEEDATGQEGAQGEFFGAVGREETLDDDDEGASGTGDLHPGAAEGGDE